MSIYLRHRNKGPIESVEIHKTGREIIVNMIAVAYGIEIDVYQLGV